MSETHELTVDNVVIVIGDTEFKVIDRKGVQEAIARFNEEDWGDIGNELRIKNNNASLLRVGEIVGIYTDGNSSKFSLTLIFKEQPRLPRPSRRLRLAFSS